MDQDVTPLIRGVLAVVPGARDAEAVEVVVGEVKGRTGGRVLGLVTSEAYGQEVLTTPAGRPRRKMVPAKVPPPGMNHATVE